MLSKNGIFRYVVKLWELENQHTIWCMRSELITILTVIIMIFHTDTVWFGKQVQVFWRNLMSASLRWNSKLDTEKLVETHCICSYRTALFSSQVHNASLTVLVLFLPPPILPNRPSPFMIEPVGSSKTLVPINQTTHDHTQEGCKLSKYDTQLKHCCFIVLLLAKIGMWPYFICHHYLWELIRCKLLS
jgi:hypothetical protein